jgi:hypothetical protein
LTSDAGDRARKWRAMAHECRAMADSMRSELARYQLLQMAHDYDTLAEYAERASQQHQYRNVG